ncbi:MAG: redoxin domain-containing protein [Pseudomonadales bacterium]|nr:redoxin domain-containing protein [Pseudomonadales bacterium]
MKQFDEAGAALIGLSVDSGPALGAWSTAMGGIRHPLLADFWPHGGVAKTYGLFTARCSSSTRMASSVTRKPTNGPCPIRLRH